MFSWKSYCSCIPQRWVFSILGGLGIGIGSIYHVILSMTIVEMVSKQSSEQKFDDTCEDVNSIIQNNTAVINFHKANDSSRLLYDWDEYTQGIILSCFFWTFSFSQFFCGFLSERFGGKYIFGLGIVVPAVINCLTPLIIDWGGSLGLILSRVLMGVPNSAMFPSVSTLISRWTTLEERAKIGNIIYSGQLLGLFLGIVGPALIIKYSGMGWPAVFYFFGIVGIVWFIAWSILVYDSPEKHPFISNQELMYFRNSKSTENESTASATPWNHILKCKEFWAFTIVLVGSNWAYYALISDLPKYMSGVVRFSLESNGYFSSVPYLFMWVSAFISTWLGDKAVEKKWMSLTNVRKLFTTISVTGPVVFMMLASYAECDKVLVAAMFMVGITIMGGVYPSIMMNPLDLSPNYAGSLMSLGNGLGATTGFVIPYVIGVLTPNQTLGEWRLVFWIIFVFSIVPNVIYLIWFNAEIKDWNDLSTMNNKKNAMKKNVETDQATF